MSFFGRIKSIFVEKIVDDEFYQPITEHEVYAVLNKKNQRLLLPDPLRSTPNQQPHKADVFAVALTVSEHTPEIEIRQLGYEPSAQAISGRVKSLKQKLDIVDWHLLEHYQEYLTNIGRSLEFYSQGKEFYGTRRKAGELRFIIEKMNKILCRSRAITKLNIHIKNIKNTLKLLEKVPNIKKMNLMELKAIDLLKLEKTNEEISALYSSRLQCLTNLSKYISKVNNESFAYIINNLKMCLDTFDEQVYEEIMRSYLIIQPQTLLEKLLLSLLEEKIRQIFDSSEGLQALGNHLIDLVINVHKIIKWHMVNRALRSKEKANETETSSNQSESESQPLRRLSIASDRSEERSIPLQLNEIVYISLASVKEMFNKAVDVCLTELAADNIISADPEHKEMYAQLQLLSKIAEICHNFTGLRFEKLRKALLDYFNRKEGNLFAKYGREFINSIEQERNDWNRLAFPNNFKFTPIDRLLYRWAKIHEAEEYKKMIAVINRLFSDEVLFSEESESEEEETLELKLVHMVSSQRLEKKFEEWSPPNYLQLYEGDVILSQSSYKMLSVFEKYTEFLIYTPPTKHSHTYYEHMLFLVEYKVFFIFSSLLSSKYKNLFFEQSSPDMPIEKIYTLKRFKVLYPKLTAFVNSFRAILEQTDSNSQTHRLFSVFRKDIREISSGEENQVLRAKVIAIQSCKYCLAYFHQILKAASSHSASSSYGLLFEKVQELLKTIHELSVLLLTESSQSMLGLQLQAIKSLFQSMRWYQSYQDLKEYVQKIVTIIRESFERLKSCNRGQIPLSTIHFIFIFIWRTILTYSVKLFLENKSNNKRENKLNFEKFIDELYFSFENRENKALQGLATAYGIFKSIFKILLNGDWEECKELLLETLKKFDYIYPILVSILESSEYMSGLSEREKDARRQEFREQIECLFKDKK